VLRTNRRLHIAINISAQDIKTGRVLDVVKHALVDTNILADQIWLEATERGFMDIDAARSTISRAREMGHTRGALYAWRTINGNECSAYYPAGTAQYHINADVAFAVSRYVESTGDNQFLLDIGAEILFETAELWLDLGFYNPRKSGQFCINSVTAQTSTMCS